MLRCSDVTTKVPVENRSHSPVHLAMSLETRLNAEMLRLVRVHVCGNELQLFGTVASWHEKQRAQELAREVAPVYRIRNELRVSRTGVLN